MRHRLLVKSIIALVLLGALGAVAGCGSARHAGEQPITSADMVGRAGPVPTWLAATGAEDTAEIYAWASAHHAELQYIPCYCGCGSMGHTSNADCYFKWGKGGAITAYEEHAFT